MTRRSDKAKAELEKVQARLDAKTEKIKQEKLDQRKRVWKEICEKDPTLKAFIEELKAADPGATLVIYNKEWLPRPYQKRKAGRTK